MDMRELAMARALAGGFGGASSWNDLTDRPFGDELGYIIPETTVDYSDEDEANNGEFLVDTLLVAGKTYVVNWEGVDYTCKCVAVSEDGVTMTCIGNSIAFGGEDTGEPFAIGTSAAEGVKFGFVTAIDEAVTSFTFSVKSEVAIPIPAQYLTNAFPYTYEVPYGSFKVDNGRHIAIMSEIPLALLEAMHLQRPIWLKVTDDTIIPIKTFIAPAQYGGQLDAAWWFVDKTLDVIPVDGNLANLDIRLAAHIASAINSFAPFYVRFAL